jgi:hypothetical protein
LIHGRATFRRNHFLSERNSCECIEL